MGHQTIDLPLPGNTAGTGFWEGGLRAANPEGRDSPLVWLCGDDPLIGGIACFEIR